MSQEPVLNEEFVQNLTRAQGMLYGYILTLLPNRDSAADVLQNTNLVLWRKAAEFAPGTNFTAWSCRVAFYEVKAFVSTKHRDRHLFDDALISRVAARVAIRPDTDALQIKLRGCLSRLSSDDHQLILSRYSKGSSVKAMASGMAKTENAVSRMLYRIRRLLADCLRQSPLAREA